MDKCPLPFWAPSAKIAAEMMAARKALKLPMRLEVERGSATIGGIVVACEAMIRLLAPK